jgi:hypothetical protein
MLDDLFLPPVSWTVAHRIEVRRQYASDLADPRWEHWLRTGEVAPEPRRPWYVLVQLLRAQGRRIERVRVVDSPATTAQEYLRATAAGNRAAGEDIRELPRVRARALGLEADVWLFEGREAVVAELLFNDADRLVDVVVSCDRAEVDAAWARWRAAWQEACREYRNGFQRGAGPGKG